MRSPPALASSSARRRLAILLAATALTGGSPGGSAGRQTQRRRLPAFRGLVLSRWKKIEVTGNTFWASGFLAEISSAPAGCGVAENPLKVDLAEFTVASNTLMIRPDNNRQTEMVSNP